MTKQRSPDGNLFSIPANSLELSAQGELTDVLMRCEGVVVERIVSHGHVTPPGEWYDQADDEWVLLVKGEAEITFDDGTCCRLQGGDHLMIAAGRRHRVTFTSSPAVWLAVFINPNI